MASARCKASGSDECNGEENDEDAGEDADERAAGADVDAHAVHVHTSRPIRFLRRRRESGTARRGVEAILGRWIILINPWGSEGVVITYSESTDRACSLPVIALVCLCFVPCVLVWRVFARSKF